MQLRLKRFTVTKAHYKLFRTFFNMRLANVSDWNIFNANVKTLTLVFSVFDLSITVQWLQKSYAQFFQNFLIIFHVITSTCFRYKYLGYQLSEILRRMYI